MKPPEELRSAGMRVSRDWWGGARRAVIGTFKLDRRSYYSTAVFLVSRHCLSLGQQTTYGPSKRNVREK